MFNIYNSTCYNCIGSKVYTVVNNISQTSKKWIADIFNNKFAMKLT